VIHKRVHFWLTIAWGLLIVPTLIWWSESILWIALISIYANMATHWGAYEAARKGEK
jgi:hypothetical protein